MKLRECESDSWASRNVDLIFCSRFVCLGSEGRKNGCWCLVKLREYDSDSWASRNVDLIFCSRFVCLRSEGR